MFRYIDFETDNLNKELYPFFAHELHLNQAKALFVSE